MKKTFIAIGLLLAVGIFAKAEFPSSSSGSALYTRSNVMSPLEGIGTVIHQTKNMMVVVYDYSVLGGALGSINLVDDNGNPAILPQGAQVTNVVLSSLTSLAGTSGTISFQVLAGSDLMNNKTTLTAGTLYAGNPVGTAATWVGPVTATAGSQVKAIIQSGALTAGKFKLFIEYVIQ